MAGQQTEPDYYAALGVAPDAEPEVIDAAYRALARKYHPDVNRDPDAGGRMRAVNEASRILQDPEARVAYDGRSSARRAGADNAERRAGEGSHAAGRPPPRYVPRDGPLDLFTEAVGDAWRRLRPIPPAWALSRRMLPVAAALGGLAGGVALGRALPREAELRGYWRVAVAARARLEAARTPFAVAAQGGYVVVVGNATFGPLATQLVAELEMAMARLRSAGRVPEAAEAYHFLQLDDWKEEREVRVGQRDGVLSRSADGWAQAGERELAWRASALHHRAEAAAWTLAARVSQVG